jgi:hypothetical protein
MAPRLAAPPTRRNLRPRQGRHRMPESETEMVSQVRSFDVACSIDDQNAQRQPEVGRDLTVEDSHPVDRYLSGVT